MSVRAARREPCRPHVGPWLALAAVLTACAGCSAYDSPEQPATAPPASQPLVRPSPALTPLAAGTPQSASFDAAEHAHAYGLELRAGDYVEVCAQQQGVDVRLTVATPEGAELRSADAAEGCQGRERALFLAPSAGTYVVRVVAVGRRQPGSFAVSVCSAPRQPTPDDKLRAAADELLSQAERQADAWKRPDRESARFAYWRAAEQWRALGETLAEAYTRRRLAMVCADLGAREEAANELDAALALAEQARDGREIGRILVERGPLRRRRGDLDGAERDYARALELAADHDPLLKAIALNNLSVISTRRGFPALAVSQADAARKIWTEQVRERATIEALVNRAVAYTWLGRSRRAEGDVRAALEIAVRYGDARGQIYAYTQLGWLRYLAADAPGALRHYREGLSVAEQRGDDEGRGTFLDRRAGALVLQRHFALARQSYDEALAIWRRMKDHPSVAHTTANLAALAADMGHPRTAQEHYATAVRAFDSLGEHDNAAHVRLQRAQLLLGSVPMHETERDISDALAGMQRLREMLKTDSSPAELAQYAAVRHQFYELWVEVLMRQKKTDAAFEAAENGRAVALSVNLADGLGGGSNAPPSLARARSLLDDDTLLLAYALGRTRSFVWLVGPHDFAVFELPPRDELRKLARVFHDALQVITPRAPMALAAPAGELGRTLLGPLAGRLGNKRLVILRDEALQYVPFAALPDYSLAQPGTNPPLLIEGHEIAYAPSVLAAFQLRKRARARRPPSRGVAVFADAVFNRADERLAGRAAAANAQTTSDGEELKLGAGDVGLGDDPEKLPRLPATAREADAIVAAAGAAGAAATPPVTGFDATRARVLRPGALDEFRYVHFATHGFLNLRNPMLSGLVLSRYDATGAPTLAFLRSADIEKLHLRADLAVASACTTALGEELRGEGLFGLTQAFLRGGASRTMVSLWPVRDNATADLMKAFYTAHLKRGLTPAAALREAQLTFLRAGRPPLYWAAFIIEGLW